MNTRKSARSNRGRTGVLIALPATVALLVAMGFMSAKANQIQPAAPASPPVMYVDLQLDEWQDQLLADAANHDPKTSKAHTLERGEEITVIISSSSDAHTLTETVEGTNDKMPPPAEPTTLRNWAPTNEEAEQLDQIRNEVAEDRKELNQRATKVREANVRMDVDSAWKDFQLNSDGGLEGAIRLLNVDKFAPEKVQPILDKYGITFERRHTKPSAGRGFLNAASTDRGTFRDVSTEGYYEVLVLSGRAVAYMATLETEALNRRNYDPATTRIRKITFGIVDNGRGELDLGVTDLQVEQIR